MTKGRKERRAEDGRKVTGREGRRAREGRGKKSIKASGKLGRGKEEIGVDGERRKERKSEGIRERCALAPCSQKIALILQI